MAIPQQANPLPEIYRALPRDVKHCVEAQATAELRRSPYAAVRRVSVVYRDGILTMCGSVPSFYLKQIAQSVVLHRLEGIAVIDNRLEVDAA